ncbi:MAG TPA: ABC transporter ATP-binding protein, partial [Anaerolineales bacterium]
GPEVSGKSTLIRLLAALLFPDSGEIRVFDYDVRRQTAQVQRQVNPVSVEASFFQNYSPLENLVRGANLVGIDGREARRQALDMLARLGFKAPEINRPMASLPRLLLQKATIARALLSPAALLLLDEPTAGLDPHSKSLVYALLRERRSQHGTTILLTTQDRPEAAELCDRAAILDRGRLTAPAVPAPGSYEPAGWARRPGKVLCS